MEISGTLIHMLPIQTGQGKNGTWKKQDFVIETTSAYPKKVCLSAWGEKVDTSKFAIGQNLKVSFDAESREYNGRWYTELRAFSVQAEGASAGGPGTDNMPPPFQGPIDNEAPDDLPF